MFSRNRQLLATAIFLVDGLILAGAWLLAYWLRFYGLGISSPLGIPSLAFHLWVGAVLTPVGLRSLAPDDPDFKPRYYGDLRSRDAAYHQGTVWGWLAGPYVDAWLKVYPDDVAGVRQALEGFVAHLDEACIGSVSEIFDAEPPFTARGCIAQAWSVAELLRCWVKVSRYERDRAGTPLATQAVGGVHGG